MNAVCLLVSGSKKVCRSWKKVGKLWSNYLLSNSRIALIASVCLLSLCTQSHM